MRLGHVREPDRLRIVQNPCISAQPSPYWLIPPRCCKAHAPDMAGKGHPLAKSALGTKRICTGCAAKFYDLDRSPIVCPTCETVFVVVKAAPQRARNARMRAGNVAPPWMVPELTAAEFERGIEVQRNPAGLVRPILEQRYAWPEERLGERRVEPLQP